MSDQDRQRDGAQGRSTVRRPRTVSFGAAEAPTTRKADDRRADVWRGEGVPGPRTRQRPDTGSPVPDPVKGPEAGPPAAVGANRHRALAQMPDQHGEPVGSARDPAV